MATKRTTNIYYPTVFFRTPVVGKKSGSGPSGTILKKSKIREVVGAKGGTRTPKVLPHQILNLHHQRVMCDEMLINTKTFPDFSLPKDVKD